MRQDGDVCFAAGKGGLTGPIIVRGRLDDWRLKEQGGTVHLYSGTSRNKLSRAHIVACEGESSDNNNGSVLPVQRFVEGQQCPTTLVRLDGGL